MASLAPVAVPQSQRAAPGGVRSLLDLAGGGATRRAASARSLTGAPARQVSSPAQPGFSAGPAMPRMPMAAPSFSSGPVAPRLDFAAAPAPVAGPAAPRLAAPPEWAAGLGRLSLPNLARKPSIGPGIPQFRR